MNERARTAVWKFAWPLGWALLTAAPYFAAKLAAPEGWRYLWILPPYAADSQAYFAWARQAYLGAFLFKLKFTSLHHAPFLFQPFFWAVGRAARLTGAELGAVSLVFKSAGVVLFWTAFRRLAERLGFRGSAFWSAMILAGFGAGIGGTALSLVGPDALGGHRPIDLWLIDASTWWALTWNALFPYSLALIVFFVETLDRASDGEPPRWAWLAGAALALLMLVHPYAAPLLAVLAAFAAALRRRPGVLWRIALPAAPVAAYLVWISRAHPLVARHGELGRMDSPSWTAVLLGLAPALALAAWGLMLGKREFLRRHALLFAWAAAALLMCRLPAWFQRKFLFGVQLPLSLLAGAAVAAIAERDRGGARTAAGLVAVALALGAPSWAFVVSNTRLSLGIRENGRYYASRDLLEALEDLARRGSPDEAVLSTRETAGLVAMTTGKAAVWGHWAQSVDAADTDRWFAALLAPGDPKEKSRRLWEKADYVVAEGDLKREIDSERGRLRWLKASARLLYSNAGASVYGRPTAAPGPS
ncbi:MAG: hypothetical protein M0D55_01240 [Elusimicrobiota bacterium]|nr:MAG: hypothetical protein M0D55_01240 [Elusimicrobiota bacterium]